MTLTITLPWPSADLSPNARLHHMALHRAKKAARDYAWVVTAQIMRQAGVERGSWIAPITVQYTFHPEIDRARDDDNFAARMKASRDGIARALGVDDKGFRQLPVIFGAKAKPALVEVTLTPAMVQVPVKGVIR